MHAGIVESFFLIFAGAAVLAAAALYTRQPLLVAYIAVGGITGPHGLAWVNDASMVSEVSEFGIIFLLFLVGLDLQPSKLRNMVGSAVITAVVSSLIFFAVSVGVMRAFGFSWVDATVAGTACMFSSTIVGLKLLPTTVLHHRHIGELVVSLLLIQDLIAILALIILSGRGTSVTDAVGSVIEVFVALPSLVIVAFVIVRFLVLPLIHKFDAFHEFIFLAAIGWCLAVASGAKAIGLSLEIGAFVAGVSMATSPIAQYIAENLRPLRDFFLVMFFFSVGAAIHFDLLLQVALPTLVLAVLLIGLKPVVFRWLIALQGDSTKVAWEAGVRLGQTSEFSLLVAYLATSIALMSDSASHVVQGATVLTFVISTYIVIFRYPSPIAVSDRLRRS
ncbi:MAG TPA: cation:proton antiporter [Pseudomonadales bacterium]|jgi:Kef-type K+ transport system membrane component KefB|nr:cation:proton antiporter [Pseudomonadales bacterium]